MNRAVYVESLKVERDAIASRPASHPERARRLADIDAELDRYAEEPAGRQIETAAAVPATPEPAPEPVVEAPAAPEPVKAAKPVPAKRAAARRAAKTAAKK